MPPEATPWGAEISWGPFLVPYGGTYHELLLPGGGSPLSDNSLRAFSEKGLGKYSGRSGSDPHLPSVTRPRLPKKHRDPELVLAWGHCRQDSPSPTYHWGVPHTEFWPGWLRATIGGGHSPLEVI